jgi:hypothetical protein
MVATLLLPKPRRYDLTDPAREGIMFIDKYQEEAS